MTTAKIKAIYISRKAGDNVSGHQKVSLKAGKGIVGDRYYSESGANRSSFKGQPDWEITLIESEVIEAFNRATGNKFHDSDFRRNLVTEGIELNNLVGKNFTIDGVQCYGVQLCEPCAGLQKRLGVRILPDLVGKGGLRAQIKSSGLISAGGSIEEA